MNEEIYNSFESYLNNEMSPQARLDFESRLQEDSQFRESFELYKETSGFLENKFSSETANFKNNLESISKEYFAENQERSTKTISFKSWYYAAAASVLVLFGTWFFMQDSNPAYTDYNQHENASFVERSESNENLKKAQDFFNQKEYSKVVVSFEKIENLKNPEYQYFYAIALIETSDYEKATSLLNDIRNGTSIYKDKATWYLALSELKRKNIEKSKFFLRQIPKYSEDYDKVEKLLKKLNK